MTDRQDWNKSIMAEFHANGGKVGGVFANATLLLLTTTGAKSGRSYTTPLVYFADGDRMTILASKGGAPTNPDWYHNLVANPIAEVEVSTERFPVRATVLPPEERDRRFAEIARIAPGFGEYARKTTRKIPVISLERIA